MPSVSVVSPTAPLRADAVVVGVRSAADAPVLAAGAEAIDRALGGRLLEAIMVAGGTGRPDEVLKIPTLGLADFPLVVATGLGPAAGLGPATPGNTATATAAETLRRGVGAALRALAGTARVHLALDWPADALAEGALLGSHSFTAYKSARPPRSTRTITLAGDAAARARVRHARIVAEAVLLTRDLVNTPPNDLYPATFAERTVELAAAAGVRTEVLDERALKRGRYGGILAVGAGSARPPRLVRLEYAPARPRAHVALVGKGVTFDSGGLNLKTANLTWMKSDMGGAAAVIAATCAIARLKVPVRVTTTVPMVENMPSGSAYRPSDVLTMHNGTTVEVADTDAEGRLVLADAISRALQDGPDRLIEASTLTGAQLVALGPRLMGAMGEDGWRDEVVRAATQAGEGAWPMPLPDELRGALDSSVADLANLGRDRWAGMLVGGRFIAEFVPAGLPWVHLDIAGPAYNQGGARDYTPKGGTGAGVRTIIATVERLAAG